MLPKLEWGERGTCAGPLVVMCHWLGGSAASWTLVAERLAECGLRCVAVDLPGFGSAASMRGYSKRAMADAVIATVQAVRAGEEDDAPWLLAGHSMGGAVATLIARDAADGAPGLRGLQGLVLVSPSPPGPEPMKESKRTELLETIGTAAGEDTKDRKNAESYVKGNVGTPAFGERTLRATVDGVLAASKAAIRAWLESGSKEDLRAVIGQLSLPALVFAGTQDEALGPDAQREHTLPSLSAAELVVLEKTGHLAPLERPGVLAARIVEFCAALNFPARRTVRNSERFTALLDSDLTSPQTRTVMKERLQLEDDPYEPQAVGRDGMRVLRELARAVVPGAPFDLAARMDRNLARGRGNGWRPAALPEDATAWRRGLLSLDAAARHAYGAGFAELHDELQHTLLTQACEGKLGSSLALRALRAAGLAKHGEEGQYSPADMKQWFEEVRGEFTKLYIADPRTMERVGFSGFADEQTFTQIRLGEREAWER